MPFKTREELQEHLARIRGEAEIFVQEHSDFVQQFPEWMSKFLPHFAFGQSVTEHAYDLYEGKKDDSLTKGQHPHYAISAPSFPTGHRNNILGFAEGHPDVGNTLVLRTVSGEILGIDLDLNPESASFAELADMKGLDKFFHVRSTGSELSRLLYDYYASGEKYHNRKFDLPAGVEEGSAFYKYIKERRTVYEVVKARGAAYYENLLDFYLGDFEASEKLKYNLTHGLSEDQRFVRAINIQKLIWGREAVQRYENAPKTTVAILQGYDSERQYVWSDKVSRFVVIPDEEDDNPNFAKKRSVFFDKLSDDIVDVGDLLIRGARNYKKNVKLAKIAEEYAEIFDAYVFCCSDSRATVSTILGPRADELRYVHREPGNIISYNGKLTPQAARTFQLARNHGKSVVTTHHSNCGAMGAINAYLSGANKELPQAFQNLSHHNKRLYATVKNLGKTPNDIDPVKANTNGIPDEQVVAYYQKLSGIPIETIDDCLGIQQVYWDYEVAKKEYPTVNVIPVYQDMKKTQNYILNPTTMKFVAVPSARGVLLEPSARGPGMDRHVCACGCGKAHNHGK